ncbi:hypothetical protein [Algoriphagus antarcticus]|uniref:Uncharacterized protein n=1 Tax=Algoriphagus antarcticus TaxID=238540 RepID=A0A3E0E0V5_9BACT|nr:hypothetical protein [Algoriphagus antarcticus]REG90959.1 hypothetical protein C8N25_10567 [Algoriphagus antarcticus]
MFKIALGIVGLRKFSGQSALLFYIIHLELSPMNIVNSNRRPAWTKRRLQLNVKLVFDYGCIIDRNM